MSAAAAQRTLLLFARAPVPGQVKTRLIPALGAGAAAAVYWQMLRDTAAVIAQAQAERRELWLDVAHPEPALRRLAAAHGLAMRVQSGSDLGARMADALAAATRAGGHAVLIGSDCPEFTPAYLDAAFDALQRYDAVLGPAADGGYVLVGLRQQPQPRLFSDIAWGGPQVLAATRQRLDALRLSRFELPVLHDLDEPADLARFPRLAAIADLPDPANPRR